MYHLDNHRGSPFFCPISVCRKDFKHWAKLRLHISQIHEEPWQPHLKNVYLDDIQKQLLGRQERHDLAYRGQQASAPIPTTPEQKSPHDVSAGICNATGFNPHSLHGPRRLSQHSDTAQGYLQQISEADALSSSLQHGSQLQAEQHQLTPSPLSFSSAREEEAKTISGGLFPAAAINPTFPSYSSDVRNTFTYREESFPHATVPAYYQLNNERANALSQLRHMTDVLSQHMHSRQPLPADHGQLWHPAVCQALESSCQEVIDKMRHQEPSNAWASPFSLFAAEVGADRTIFPQAHDALQDLRQSRETVSDPMNQALGICSSSSLSSAGRKRISLGTSGFSGETVVSDKHLSSPLAMSRDDKQAAGHRCESHVETAARSVDTASNVGIPARADCTSSASGNDEAGYEGRITKIEQLAHLKALLHRGNPM